jgi:hypothetical protein
MPRETLEERTGTRSTCGVVAMALLPASSSRMTGRCAGRPCFVLQTGKNTDGDEMRMADEGCPPPSRPGGRLPVARPPAAPHRGASAKGATQPGEIHGDARTGQPMHAGSGERANRAAASIVGSERGRERERNASRVSG